MENTMNPNQNMFLDWNDVIENDGQEFVILPEGDYDFRVTEFERGRFPGSAKLPACNKSTLTLSVDTPEGTANVKVDLIMYRSLEWRISAFFRSIGLKQHGEKLVMDWNHVVGATGRAHFKPRSYKDKNGNDRQANDVERFIDPVPGQNSTPGWVQEVDRQLAQQTPPQHAQNPYPQQQYQQSQYTQQQMPMPPQQGSWRGGKF